MREFQDNIEGVSGELSRFPYKDKDAEQKEQIELIELQESNTSTKLGKDAEQKKQIEPIDKQVFHLQQRAIGEIILIKADSGEQILSYSDFLNKWLDRDDSKFKNHLKPLENFLEDVTPESLLVWKRLRGMRTKLQQFEELCDQVLRPSPGH